MKEGEKKTKEKKGQTVIGIYRAPRILDGKQ